MDYARRRAAVARALQGSTTDALLITHPTNVRYLCGFSGSSGYLAVSADKTILLTDARYTDQASEECPGIEIVIRHHTRTIDQAAAELLTQLNAHTVGVEGSVTRSQQQALAVAGPALTFGDLPTSIERMRAVKDADELAAIRHAVRVAERAFKMFLPQVRGADSEKDLHDALDGFLRRAGATASGFPPITAIGERSGRPHASPDPAVRLDSAGILLIDWGADCGYVSDLTRTVKSPFGPPSQPFDFDEVYAVVCRAQDAAVATVRAGVAAKDVDGAARRVFTETRLCNRPDVNLADHFTHGLGHGLGLDVHELPRVRMDSTDVLEVGMVITLEPAVYLPGWGGIRVEDDYLVTAEGCERLSTLPRDPEVLL